MDINIEKNLQTFKSRIIDHTTLSNIIKSNGYIGIKDKIKNLKENGFIQSLKKGFYLHTSPFSNNIYSKEIIANTLLSPSYISFDYALSYYGLIPERVHDISSATTKRSKDFDNCAGKYSYKQIKKELYPIGLKIQKCKIGNFLIASSEKALCDKVYYTKDIQISNKKAMLEFLIDDLRMDLDELYGCDVSIVSKYYEVSKSKKIYLLEKVLGEVL